MSDVDYGALRDSLTAAVTKAIKAAKRLGYSGEAFTTMAGIAWSSYQAGESETRQAERDKKAASNGHTEEKHS